MAPINDPANDSDDNSTSDTFVSLAAGRSRREKKDKGGKLAALARLREVKQKGGKNKYEKEEEAGIYEEVDEDEYSDIVRKRQEEDWIVDDDGSGYVEDGREIFDEDLDDDQFAKPDKKKDDKKKRNPNIVRPGTKPKANIKSMFAAQAATGKRKPERDASVRGDELLGDIMSELHSGPSQGDLAPPPPVKLTKKRPTPAPARAPHMPFSTGRPSLPPTMRTAPTKGLPKPVIKTEPIEEECSPMIEEFDSQDEKENMLANVKQETDMELGDIDFDDEVEDVKPVVKAERQEIKKEVKVEPLTAIKVKNEKAMNFETISTGWASSGGQSEPSIDVQVDTSQIPLVTNESGDQVLRFYWLDAFEDQYKHPGVVYLFGKVWVETAQVHVSCCVTVRNIERQLFMLPRPTKMCLKTNTDTGFEVTLMEVYSEFSEKVVEKYKIGKFKTRKISKNYAFEIVDVPAESDYLEIRYDADGPTLPSDLKGETFSRVFGTNTSSLERLLIDRRMKGPGWIDIKCPQITNPPISWCKLEVSVNGPDCVTVCSEQNLAPPPLVAMTLNFRTLPNSKTHQNEIIGAACLINSDFHMDKPTPEQTFDQHFCVISKPNDCIFPWDFNDKVQKESKRMKVEVLPTERALLGFLLAKIHKIDPDIIVGHDIYGYDLDILLHRINSNKIPHWSKIGRLKRTVMPKLASHPGRGASHSEKSATCGRIVCDLKISAKELVRLKSFDLTELALQILKQKRVELDFDQIRNMYNSSQHLLQLIELTLMDSSHILNMMYELNVIPLALQITTICGNVMSRTLMGGRAERNEFLLLHAFSEKDFIVPDKEYKKKISAPMADDDDDVDTSKSKTAQGRRKPAYAGGLVLEPKKGFYDKFILLLDFNSLYPSIIQEYNICFTTIARTEPSQTKDSEEDLLNIELPSPDLKPGILPTEIRKLVESRRQVKNLMKQDGLSPEQMMQYDIRQKALKLTANSMYGCLGFTFSRFYAKPLAALITMKGREILMQTKDLVQAMNLDVIYGDTDSIMVNSNCTDVDQVTKLGNKIKAEVNKLYKLLEIDIDGIYKSMLLLKKKKYAALSVHKGPDGKYTTQEEKKGLDIVRRDWSGLAKEVGDYVVSTILSGENREVVVEKIHARLNEVGEEVKEDRIPMEQYLITKQLTKNPEDYPDKKSLPHVQVAMRLNSKGGKRIKGGDTVAYIVCEDGSNLPASQRAYHPDELAKSESLKKDVKYYLAHQIHPVVSRLCDPIEGTDASHIAECLGLDPSGYRHASNVREENEDDDLLGGVKVTDEEKYKDCERLKVICPSPNCKREILLDGPFTGADVYIEASLGKCRNEKCSTLVANNYSVIGNQLTVAIRNHIRKYYQGMLKCEDTACSARMRKLPLVFQRGHPICPACNRGILHPEYTDSMLYTQMCFYQYVFDIDRAVAHTTDKKEKEKVLQVSKEPEIREAYAHLRHIAENWLKRSEYSEVNLDKLFEGLFHLKG
ncbi:DNA polymerase alpha catalytic subunit-like [Mya arenaria]|uniref:DNA polymerase alpha catalytic subunit-like n=1 Tax=Mya arenaria TaxID=6604 RepID=UPI0022E4ED99|nr:DNA polymerase alpha catalytic subunit-like [Mya arenaria]